MPADASVCSDMTLRLSHIFSRWRHGRGFGIHSPFAYRFVTEVLRQEMGYYAYLRMPGNELYRTIFRIILFLRPDSVALIGTEEYRRAVREAVPNALMSTPAKAELIIVDGFADKNFELHKYSDKHVIVLNYRHLKAWTAYKKAMSCGMTFANRDSIAVATVLHHLPRQDYEVKF